jgi:hypothetical protein
MLQMPWHSFIQLLLLPCCLLLLLHVASELNEAILDFAAGLKAHGLQQGDKVRGW